MATVIICVSAIPALAAFVALTRDHTVTIYGSWEQAGRNSLRGRCAERATAAAVDSGSRSHAAP